MKIMASDSYIAQYDSNVKGEPFQNRPNQVRFTQEEIRILRECNHESFFYRCLPFGVTAMATTYLAVKKGYMKSHPKYGATLKMLGAGFLGWFVGKISYRSICEDKFLKLPNSTIGDAVRKQRGYIPSEFRKDKFKSEDDLTLSPDDSQYLPDTNYDASFGALNLDMDKNIQSPGLDDRGRPTTDSFSDLQMENKPQKSTITYEELRKRNRESYEQQFKKPNLYPPPISSPSRWDTSPQKRNQQDESPEKTLYNEWDKD